MKSLYFNRHNVHEKKRCVAAKQNVFLKTKSTKFSGFNFSTLNQLQIQIWARKILFSHSFVLCEQELRIRIPWMVISLSGSTALVIMGTNAKITITL